MRTILIFLMTTFFFLNQANAENTSIQIAQRDQGAREKPHLSSNENRRRHHSRKHNADKKMRHDRRQQRQNQRIEQGERKGTLTEEESKRLQAGQERLDQMEDRAESDGVVTDREKHRLEKAQDRQSRRIHRLKHNDKNKNENESASMPPMDEENDAAAGDQDDSEE